MLHDSRMVELDVEPALDDDDQPVGWVRVLDDLPGLVFRYSTACHMCCDLTSCLPPSQPAVFRHFAGALATLTPAAQAAQHQRKHAPRADVDRHHLGRLDHAEVAQQHVAEAPRELHLALPHRVIEGGQVPSRRQRSGRGGSTAPTEAT